ncbi:MAG: dockerin type I repeat-containing protein [Clostridia bacterium]|nr:dockerin type I repeat-containing protein [Clostridia bacterium]
MKRIISVILTFALLIGVAPLAVFAGGGNDFPPVPCVNEGDPIRGEGDLTFNYTGDAVYIDFYSGSAGIYVFESTSDLDLQVYVYDSDGNLLARDDDSGEDRNFKCYCYVGFKTDVYLWVGGFGSSTGQVTVSATYSDVTGVELKHYPDKTTYLPTDSSPDLEGLVFEISYRNGDKATWIPYDGRWSTIDSPDGVACRAEFDNEIQAGYENGVTLSCYGYNFHYYISVRAYYFDEARVTRMPYRTEYIVGLEDRSFYPNGMLIQLYKNGSPVETVNFNNESEQHPFVQEFVTPEEYALGDNEVTVRFTNGVTAELTVTGIENPYTSIEMVKLPDKMLYDITPTGFFFTPDLTGGVLRINYKNGDHYDYEFDNSFENMILGHYYTYQFENWNLEVGANTVIIEFCGMTCRFDVTGVASNIKGIELIKLPDRRDFYVGETHPSIIGAKLRVDYVDNTYKVITFDKEERYVDGFYIDFWFDGPAVVGPNTATLWYGGYSATIDVTFHENNIKRVTVAHEPNKTEFGLHSVILPEDLDGLILNITYNDGSQESWVYSENNGRFKGADVFYSDSIERSGYNPIELDMAGHPATLYLLAKDFFVMSHKIIRNADANGSNANVTFYLEDGDSINATFPGVYEGDYASGYIGIAGFGNYSYSLYRNVVQDGVKGVHLYAFGLNNPIFIPMEEGGAMKGDMDGDGEITVADALKALRIAAKLVQPTEEDIALGDVDNDGEITVADALKILRVAAKLADASSLG